MDAKYIIKTFSAPMTREGPSFDAEPGRESFSARDPSAMVSPKAGDSVVRSLMFNIQAD